MSNSGTNEIIKNIMEDVELNLRLFLDKICSKYKLLNIDRESVRETAKEILGIEIEETRREFLMKEWDPSNKYPFSHYTNGSGFKAKWICEKGHSWPSEIKGRMKGHGCPYCSNKKICEDGSNSLGVLRPEFIDSWDPENELSIFQVSVGSSRMAKWICEKGHKTISIISDRTSGHGCPICNGKKIADDKSNSLGVLRPEFIKQWDPDNKLSIFDVTVNSGKLVGWICEKGHKFPSIINNRTGRGDGCPFCSNKKIAEDKSNSLGVLRPEFIDQWFDENEISIFDVTVGSDKIVKWICKKGHIYPSSIKNRVLQSNGCPYCSNKKICEDGSNSLGILRPEFINQWSSKNELTIFQISVGSKYLAKWICEKNHSYEMQVCKRSSKKDPRGCPECNETKGEKFINIYLSENNLEFTTQYKISYNECSGLRYDFYLKKYNSCIEFDGRQHFDEIDYFGGRNGFLERIRNDNYKNLYCKENSMSLIRIHHLDINDTNHLSDLISQIDIENPKLILSKNYPQDWLYTMY